MQCGYQMDSGKLCTSLKLQGSEGCWQHPRNLPAVVGRAAPAERDLTTIKGVVEYLSDLIKAVDKEDYDPDRAKVIGSLCKEQISAIKQRDANAPTGADLNEEELRQAMKLIGGDHDKAMEYLMSKDEYRVLLQREAFSLIDVTAEERASTEEAEALALLKEKGILPPGADYSHAPQERGS